MMNNIRILQLIFYIYMIKVNCDSSSNENINSKKIIPYFRRQVEEIEDKNLPETADKDDPQSNLVSFIVNNVKELFDDDVDKPDSKSIYISNASEIIDEPETTTSSIHPILTYRPAAELLRPTVNATETETESYVESSTLAIFPTRTNVILYENLTLSTLLEDIQTFPGLYGINTKTTSTKAPDLKNVKYIDKIDKKDGEVNLIARAFSNSYFTVNASETEAEQDPRRSCILCNNVASEDCNDPKNKLIQSIMCERDDDTCYSMHTPFGIVDRGCFNSNHNLTTYVCSCNLCNYISISEMPYTFNNKRDWVENVVDISRTRQFRKSIFKDMSCLKCEVNTTQQQGDILDSANCLEGHIGSVPVTQCGPNEVCGVKALRADGYIWRGCMKTPLYNYWWSLCDYDLCNFDSIISLYDFV